MFGLLAACGTPAAPKLPDSGTSVASLLATLDAAADRACACTDRYCTDEVDHELADALRRPDPARPLLDDAQLPQLDAAMHRGARCMWAHDTVGTAYGAVAVEAAAAYRDDVCACTDRACVRALDGAPRAAMLHLIGVPLDPASRDAIGTFAKATAECKLAHAGIGGEDLIGEITALTDEACRCTDAACTRDVVDVFFAWAKAYEKVVATPDQGKTIAELGRKFTRCVGAIGTGGP
jgi:hypothetical protein